MLRSDGPGLLVLAGWSAQLSLGSVRKPVLSHVWVAFLSHMMKIIVMIMIIVIVIVIKIVRNN